MSTTPHRPRRLLTALAAGLLAGALLPAAATAAVEVSEITDPTPGSTPSGLVADAGGVSWFTDPGTGRIVRVGPTNVLQGFDANVVGSPAGGPPPALTPQRIALGPDGALWYTISEGGIARMTKAGVVTRYPVVRLGRSAGIAPGPDGAMWFTLPDADRIGRITAPTDAEFSAGAVRGQVATYATTPGGTPDDIELNGDGALWFTEPGTNSIGRAVPGGQGPAVASTPLPTPGGAPTRLTNGPDGRIWFNAPGTRRIGRVGSDGRIVELPLPAVGGAPGDVATSPDGGLWFVEVGSSRNALGRVEESGAVSRTELSDPQGALSDIVRGSDGDLRYTRAGGRVGRASTLVPGPPAPPPGRPGEPPTTIVPTQTTPPVAPALAPVAGRSVILEVVSGTIRIRRPGAAGYEPLPAGGASLPDGTEVDATKGRIRITAETSPGSGITRTAVFWDGRFVIRQARTVGASTELRLTGRLTCGATVAQRGLGAPAETRAKRSRKKKPKVGRRLWGDGKGDFRTRGSRATASVTGTRWLVEDRCDRTTRVRVFVGVVSVRDRIRNRRVTLREGDEYVAPVARRRR